MLSGLHHEYWLEKVAAEHGRNYCAPQVFLPEYSRLVKKLIESIKASRDSMLIKFRSRAGRYSQRGFGYGLGLVRDARTEAGTPN